MVERPQQIVATTQTIADAVGSDCVTILPTPGTGDMLDDDIVIAAARRALLLSFCFEVATTVSVYKDGVELKLFEGATFSAGCLYSKIEVPVEIGDSINFRLGTNNDGSKTRLFKVEAVIGW